MELQYKIILAWITFTLITGIAEAFYFNKNQRHVKVLGLNIHFWFGVIRSLVAAPLCFHVFIDIGLLESILMGVIMILSFPFFHDAVYYTTRELLKKGTYPKTWLDQSKETDATLSFNIYWRVVFLIITLLIFPY